ncbi:EAL domain-containing protein, partial [Acetobacterium tundrae]|nr:EAL domain-containing protein [Acetobacterium tundrae]
MAGNPLDFSSIGIGNHTWETTVDLKKYNQIVAEGIETKEEVDILRKLNCDIIQG